MKIPVDSPEWLQGLLGTLEEDTSRLIANAKSSDEALKASGAFLYFLKIKDAVESEAEQQELMLAERVQQLNKRT